MKETSRSKFSFVAIEDHKRLQALHLFRKLTFHSSFSWRRNLIFSKKAAIYRSLWNIVWISLAIERYCWYNSIALSKSPRKLYTTPRLPCARASKSFAPISFAILWACRWNLTALLKLPREWHALLRAPHVSPSEYLFSISFAIRRACWWRSIAFSPKSLREW